MKLSDQLRHDNDSGDFGRALEGYAERAEQMESALEAIIWRIDRGGFDDVAIAVMKNTAQTGLNRADA